MYDFVTQIAQESAASSFSAKSDAVTRPTLCLLYGNGRRELTCDWAEEHSKMIFNYNFQLWVQIQGKSKAAADMAAR